MGEQRYRIVTAPEPVALERIVSGLIESGWVPQGGVSAWGRGVMQAMVKPPTLDEQMVALFGAEETEVGALA